MNLEDLRLPAVMQVKHRVLPFTQFIFPNGRRRLIQIPCPPEVEPAANFIMEKGGTFEVEILTTGHVSFTVEHPEWEAADAGCVAIQLANNNVTENRNALVKLITEAMVRIEQGPPEEDNGHESPA